MFVWMCAFVCRVGGGWGVGLYTHEKFQETHRFRKVLRTCPHLTRNLRESAFFNLRESAFFVRVLCSDSLLVSGAVEWMSNVCQKRHTKETLKRDLEKRP